MNKPDAVNHQSGKARSYGWLLIACGFVGSVLVWNSQQIEARANRVLPATADQAQDSVTRIRVVTVQNGQYQARVSGYGAASARYELSLSSQVSGQVLHLGESFTTGSVLKKGDVLLTLDDSRYREAVATAAQSVADARVALLEEQRESEQARTEWQSSGFKGEPDSPLRLRKPQLAAAKAALEAAEAGLQSARNDLQHTRIVAPFDALVTERLVSPGSYVSTGTQVATLMSTDRIEISLALSAREWQMLPDISQLTATDWPVAIDSVEGSSQWRGRVLRAEQHLDTRTRQRALIVGLEQPLQQSPLLPLGTFVKASLPGQGINNLWRLPASALSQKSEIWYVRDEQGQNVLDSFATDALFADAEAIYIPVPEALRHQPQQVVVQPLSSYIKGMWVNPEPVPADSVLSASSDRHGE